MFQRKSKECLFWWVLLFLLKWAYLWAVFFTTTLLFAHVLVHLWTSRWLGGPSGVTSVPVCDLPRRGCSSMHALNHPVIRIPHFQRKQRRMTSAPM